MLALETIQKMLRIKKLVYGSEYASLQSLGISDVGTQASPASSDARVNSVLPSNKENWYIILY
jgi:hypothetical protein